MEIILLTYLPSFIFYFYLILIYFIKLFFTLYTKRMKFCISLIYKLHFFLLGDYIIDTFNINYILFLGHFKVFIKLFYSVHKQAENFHFTLCNLQPFHLTDKQSRVIACKDKCSSFLWRSCNNYKEFHLPTNVLLNVQAYLLMSTRDFERLSYTFECSSVSERSNVGLFRRIAPTNNNCILLYN